MAVQNCKEQILLVCYAILHSNSFHNERFANSAFVNVKVSIYYYLRHAVVVEHMYGQSSRPTIKEFTFRVCTNNESITLISVLTI